MERKVYVIHENQEWTKPLFDALNELNVPYEDWFLHEGTIDLTKEPPEGIFYNRMSASSHTRNHRFSPEYTASVLSWLESHGRVVLNNSRALQLEISKVAQYTSLQSFGIPVPKTIAAIGKEQILEAASSFSGPFITKHNRAGKGLGVRKFHSLQSLKEYVESDEFEPSIDGITLVQQYIEAPKPYIMRCEFINGSFFYAVRVDTSQGFELCPADACQIGDSYCPTTKNPMPKFEIIQNYENPYLKQYESFLRANNIHFAGIECIEDQNGNIYTYDVNTNTNYNPEAEAKAGLFGMRAIAKELQTYLTQLESK